MYQALKKCLNYFDWSLRKTATLLIYSYRYLLSPVIGNNCRFYPTCSSYAIQALDKKPFSQALVLIIKRISKCHPYHSGGHDPVR